jgi:hypothetical protein
LEQPAKMQSCVNDTCFDDTCRASCERSAYTALQPG